eukprot:TRINITY_DN52806_c0_g1_i1.p1 TRINITY_DN52806_c0_g1~~TRINITY_DN52806_c0_g1_i1.p1  ORF type:complete len:345 (-),score=49.21 TRINITY_DN52806_c0_g1_i1:112-1065(-)
MAVEEREQWLFTASKDNAVMVYDTKRQMIQCEVQTPAPTTTMLYIKVQKRLFTGLANGRTVVWDASILPIQQLASVPETAADAAAIGRIGSLDYDVDMSTLFAASKECLSVWAVKCTNNGSWGRKVGQIPTSNVPTAIAWSSSSREVLAGYAGGAVVAFDVDKNAPSFAWQAHGADITEILWLNESRCLITASKDKSLKIWDFPGAAPREKGDTLGPTISTAPHVPGDTRRAVSQGHSLSGPPPDPLTGRSAQNAQAGYATAYNAGPTQQAPYGGSPYGGSTAPPPTVAKQQLPVGAKPGTALRAEDSDDDLVGWDR